MLTDLTATTDPEAAAFFADARTSLTPPPPRPKPSRPKFSLPVDWPVVEAHTGDTITVEELRACRGHATRISFDWMGARRAMWVGQFRSFGWSILAGSVGEPASVLVSPYSWHATVGALNGYIAPGRAFGGDRLTVDAWVPEFITVCLAHGDGCGEYDGGHNFVTRRTLPRYPVGMYRPCGAGDHDGIYRYRFQVDGRWRQRFGCHRHHEGLLGRFLGEADATVTVRKLDDHVDFIQIVAHQETAV